MHRLLAVLFFVIGFANAALAQECTPAINLEKHALNELHIARAAVFMVEGSAEVAKYLAAVGAPSPPADSTPKGLLIVEGPTVAYVGIIEPSDCVHYSLAVPISVHALALAKVMKGA